MDQILEPMKDKLVRGLSKVYFLIAAIILIISLQASELREGRGNDNSLRCMFYNAENLFDTVDSPLDDNEFLPSSERHWTPKRYKRKLNSIAKVIIAGGDWEPPDIIGLCEIENQEVLNDLVSTTVLSADSYRTLYAHSLDRRGIGVGMIYRDKLELIYTRNYYPVTSEGDSLFTRSVLFASLADKYDTLGIIISHWPSRRGGASATDPLREILAGLITEIIDIETSREAGVRKIVVMGDLNCNPDSYIMSDIIKLCGSDHSPDKLCLYNICGDNKGDQYGSYKYQGRWNFFDQVLINNRLRESHYGYKYKEGSFRVLSNSKLLIRDNTYKGYKPNSTWRGPVYQGGYSDHLPVLFDLDVVKD